MGITRKLTNKIFVGKVPVGGDSPITIQSMTNTDTKNVKETVQQILDLEMAGCDIVRSAINDKADALAIKAIKENTNIPFIADIQFDYKLGIMSVENGCDCLRINPGNIGSEDKVKKLVDICKKYKIPIRIGVNSGSLSKDILRKHNGVNINSLVESAINEINLLEKLDFTDIKVSIKSSNVIEMIESYKKISELINYPLHLGVTEAGLSFSSTIKSSIGIGTLLSQGIGDTLRVSITGDPIEEIKVGKEILKVLGLKKAGINLISCPTCSRTKVDLISIAMKIESLVKNIDKDISIAVMGCPVNGPGEAREADLGLACGKSYGVIFKKGKVLKQVDEKDMIDVLIEEIRKFD